MASEHEIRTIELPDQWAEFVDGLVLSGLYRSPGRVDAKSLRLLELRDRQRTIERLRAEIEEAWLQSETEPGIPGETVFAELQKLSDERPAKLAGKCTRPSPIGFLPKLGWRYC